MYAHHYNSERFVSGHTLLKQNKSSYDRHFCRGNILDYSTKYLIDQSVIEQLN